MQKTLFVFTIQAVLLSTSLWAAQQGVVGSPKVLVKEIHFTGDLGLPLARLQEYTEFLSGHRVERAKLLEEAASAVREALRNRGYLKAQTMSQIHSLRSVNSEDTDVAVELTIKAGKQYRIREMTFVGLSTELPEADLKQAFTIHEGDIADAGQIGAGMVNLQTLFKRKGNNVYVVPEMVFDEVASTVSYRFDIEK